MKKLIVLILLFVCVNSVATESFQILGVDYNLTDQIVRPISLGLTTWTDKKNGTSIGLFSGFCCLSHENKLRFEMGAAFVFEDGLDVAPLTGVSTPISEDFILGAWYAPFWNLYNSKYSDDPWGIMFGYRF